MARVYTNVFDVIKEVQFYNAVVTGDQLNISYFRQIIQNRWPWMVSNWSSLYKRFESFANGNDKLVSDLESLNREVDATKLGSKTNPFNFQNKIQQFDDFIELIAIDELSATPEEISYINQQIQIITNLNINDFQNAILFLKKQKSIFAQEVGLGSIEAANLLGITISPKKREPTIDDLAKMDEVQSLIQIIEGIVYNLQLTSKRPPNLLQFANQSITPSSDVTIIDSYQSYETQPFEISLEHMAQKFLGSKERVYELLTVNNLQPPYVDEQGIKISLLSNGSINTVIIPADQRTILYVGQKVSIGSAKYREETRIIERVILNENNTMVLFLSGARNLDRFLISQNAFVRAYQPHTTRRGQYVLIPLTRVGFSPGAAKTPSEDILQRLSSVFINFGIDIAHDENTGDLLIDSNGNFKYSFGLRNVKQAVLNAVKTERGELPFHPDYGVNLSIGDRFYGTVDEGLIFAETLRDSIMRDTRFTNVLISGISTTGNSISIKLNVYLDGSNEPVPLSFIS